MSKTRLISAASQIVEAPDLFENHIGKKWKDICPRLSATSEGAKWICNDKAAATAITHTFAPNGKAADIEEIAWLSSAEGRQWLQQREDIDGEVLYSNPELWAAVSQTADPAFVLACHQAYNDWLAELVEAGSDRFIGIAKIPSTSVQDAKAELIRAVERLGLRGAELGVWPAGIDEDGGLAESDPFWEAAAGLGVPVSITSPLSQYELETSPLVFAGAAPKLSYDLNAMVFANVFDRFPDLRMVVAVPGMGWAPSSFEASDETYMRMSGSRTINLGNEDLMPSDYLRRHFWFTVQDDAFAIANRETLGPSHLMWASFSNTPDSVWPESRELFETLTEALPQDVRGKLGSETISKLYKLPGMPDFTPAEVTDYEVHRLL